uniref:Chromo domain-containing protein n=1 Tax=Syphacia muris TaxID=451379 RepID=A0A0N5B0R5_9BILA
MDEGDDYVPQISQLDYSLVGDGSGVIPNDSNVFTTQSQNLLQYGTSNTLMQQRQMQVMGTMVPSQRQMMPNITQLPPLMPSSAQKPKVTRRRKNAQQNHISDLQRQINQTNIQTPGTSNAMISPQQHQKQKQQQQYMMGNLNSVTNIGGIPQKPMVNPMQQHVQMMEKLGNNAQICQVHDPYHNQQLQQQQQSWYQDHQQPPQSLTYRPASDFIPPQSSYGARPLPQQSYYQQHQEIRFPHPYYQNPGYPSSSQVGNYPISGIRPSVPSPHISSQYYPDQGYYGMHNNHMVRPTEEMSGVGQMAQPHSNHSSTSWQCPNIPEVSGYGKPLQPSQQYSLQMEIRQIEQQLQTMYDIPNRTMQMAHQIEQLQMRLQYLQQCASVGECHNGPAPPPPPPPPQIPDNPAAQSQQQNQQQPVSVMQRGSEVQVSIKPDMPGHTLISVYHQYPSNAPPSVSSSFSQDNANSKDCIPPEPIPSTARNREPSRSTLPSLEQPLSMISSLQNGSNEATDSKLKTSQQSKTEIFDAPIPSAPVEVATTSTQCLPTLSENNTEKPKPTLFEHPSAEAIVDKSLYSLDAKNSKENLLDKPKTLEVISSTSLSKPITKTENVISKDHAALAMTSAVNNEQLCSEEVVNSRKNNEECLLDSKQTKVDYDVKEKTTEESLLQCDSSEVESAGKEQKETGCDQSSTLKKINTSGKQNDLKLTLPDVNTNSSIRESSSGGIYEGLSVSVTNDTKVKEELNDQSAMKVHEGKIEESDVTTAEHKFDTEEKGKDFVKSVDGVNSATIPLVDGADADEKSIASKDVGISRESSAVALEEKETERKHVSKRKIRGRKFIPPKKRRRDEDTSDGCEDEEFVPEQAKRSRKKGRVRRREIDIDPSLLPDGCVEKRRSGRMLGVEKKSYDLQAKWDEMEEELVDNDDNISVKEVRKEEPSEFVVEKIISVRKNGDQPDTYFVKYRNKSVLQVKKISFSIEFILFIHLRRN